MIFWFLLAWLLLAAVFPVVGFVWNDAYDRGYQRGVLDLQVELGRIERRKMRAAGDQVDEIMHDLELTIEDWNHND